MMFDRATRASHGRIIDRQSGWRDRRGGLAWWARFRLTGDVSSGNLSAVRPVLGQLIDGTVTATQAGSHVEGVMEGEDARDVNRRLLSALRRAGRRTRLRAEWTGGRVTYRFFDYVPKGTTTASPSDGR